MIYQVKLYYQVCQVRVHKKIKRKKKSQLTLGVTRLKERDY